MERKRARIGGNRARVGFFGSSIDKNLTVVWIRLETMEEEKRSRFIGDIGWIQNQ